MKNVLRKINKALQSHKKLILILVIIVGVFCIAGATMGQTPAEPDSKWYNHIFQGVVFSILGVIANFFIWVCGTLISAIIDAVVRVTQYNNFINEPTIIEAWTIIRNLCNMFFVLVLLVIAFATILRYENYSMKRLLPKLIIMAILINFSRMICGLIIDFTQVIMLTFVDAIKNPQGSWINALGVDKYLEVIKDNKWIGNLDWKTSLGGVVLGIIFLLVATVTVFVVLIVFLMRIVMLWLYVVLSPLAFLLSAFPRGQEYANKWWNDFVKYAVTGPLLAFFVWLALISSNNAAKEFQINPKAFGPNEILGSGNFLNFLIAIGMLIGGLMLTQQLGGITGNMAGKGIGWAKSAATKYTGARYVGDRWGAFQARREGARKTKVELAGDRMYGAYRKATQTPKAMLAGTASLTGVDRAYGAVKRGVSRINPVSRWNQRKAIQNEHRENMLSQMNNASDPSTTRDGYTYTRTSTGVRVTDAQGKRVTGMSAAGAKFAQGYRKTMSATQHVIDESTKKKVDKIKGSFAGLESQEVSQIGDNPASSSEARAAAAMEMSERGDWQSREQLQDLKSSLANFPSMLKEFNKNVDKTHPVWNYDQDTLNAKVAAGEIDLKKLDLSQIENNLDAVIEAAGDEFKDVAKAIGNRGSQANERLNAALGSTIDRYNKGELSAEGDAAKGRLRSLRSTHAERTGNIRHAFHNDKAAQETFIENAKVDQIDSMLRWSENGQDNDDLLRGHISEAQYNRYTKADKDAGRTRRLEQIYNSRPVRGKSVLLDQYGK